MTDFGGQESRPRPAANRLLELAAGQRLGRYEILGEIGAGGMATVYKAKDVELQRVVALKVLPGTLTRDEKFVTRFLHEARTVARLQHPSIVQVHDIGQDRGAWYISMEMIEGRNLSEYQREETPALEQSVRIAAEIAEAIAYTHEHGVMHRDLKPSNVLMRNDLPVVIDFGLAKDLSMSGGASLTSEGEMIGSPAYMSPEQARGGQIDRSTDICSLGILLYELISFKNPYLDPRSFHQTVVNVIGADPVPLRQLCPWVDQDLAAVVHKAMARERTERYATIGLFAADLRSWLAGRPVSVRRPTMGRRFRHWTKDHARALWTGAAVLALIAGVSVWWGVQDSLSKPSWTISIEESFDSPTPNLEFRSFQLNDPSDTAGPPSKDWMVDEGRLICRTSGYSMTRSTQEFPGDVRVEFDVTGLAGTNHDFNAFLCGESPQEGARFVLGRSGTNQAGIEAGSEIRWLPGLVYLRPDKTYRVAIERDREILRLELDGKLVEERPLVQPLLPKGGCHLGFSTWNGHFFIDNIRVRRRAVPLRPEPTVVADAFLDIGELDRAMDAYRLVAQAYPAHPSAQEARLKLGTVLLARKQLAQAKDLFEEVANKPANRDLRARALLLRSHAERSVGDGTQSLKILQMLADESPDNPAVIAGIQLQLDRMESCLDLSQPMFFGCSSDGETVLRALAHAVPSHQSQFGPQHLRFAEALRLWAGIAADTGFLMTALQFTNYYQRSSPEIAAGLSIVKAKHLRDMKKMDEASELLRQIAQAELFPKAVRARREAMLELGRTHAWEGRPAEAEKWFKQVIDDPISDPDLVAQATFEWGVATVLARRDAKPRWEAILQSNGAPWLLRQSALFLLARIDEATLKASYSGASVPATDVPLISALQALQKSDLVTWHQRVDEYVRGFPWSTDLWELRRVSQWANNRTPRPPEASR
ncbi:MAG TPA: protein kinase [Fibrobacteria bacterium]|nr:protein kinase [Fibrobacteria bacterium]